MTTTISRFTMTLPIAERLVSSQGVPIHTEHGLSYVVETTVDGEISIFLFDFGLNPGTVLQNMAIS